MVKRIRIPLSESHPEIAAQYHPTLNTVPLEMLSRGTSTKIWWKCEEGHEWEASPGTRVAGYGGCKYCSGKLVLAGKTDLASSQNERVVKEWHPTKNALLRPEYFTPKSGQKVWWLGSCGHEWEASIYSRAISGRGCPFCAGVKILLGFNDFATVRPQLALLWHPTKNTFSPQEVTAGSFKSVWILCLLGHETYRKIYAFARDKGCLICINRKLLVGFNDLATTYPEVAAQWHAYKNNGFTPFDVMAGSGKYAWWACPNGHEWYAQINSRKRGNGCKECGKNGISKVEEAFLAELQATFLPDAEPGTIKTRMGKRALKVDIVGTYKDNKVAIEYDGSRWHAPEEIMKRDILKTQALLDEGYLLVRIREKGFSQTLDMLPVSNLNLLQFQYEYQANHRFLKEAVQTIEEWLLEKVG